jgi:hypothetical protein
MLEGGCFCGAVRYRVEGEPLMSGTCHCRTCRKVASAPNLPFVTFKTSQFEITRGELVAFRSSPQVVRSFCGQCGSPLTYRSDAHSDHVDVMTMSLDDPEAWPPSFHVWGSHKLGWEKVADGLPIYPQSRSEGLTASPPR